MNEHELPLAARDFAPDGVEARGMWQQFDSLLESAPFGLALVDEDLRFLKVNRTLAALTGKSIEEHVGKTFWALLPGSSAGLVASFELLREKLRDCGEVRGLPFSGDGHPLRARHWVVDMFRVVEAGAAAYGAIVRDITSDRHQLILRDLLQRVTSGLAATQTIEEAAAVFSPSLVAELGGDCGGIFLLDGSQAELVPAALVNMPPGEFVENLGLDKGIAPCLAAQHKQALWMEHPSDGVSFSLSPNGVRRCFALPLLLQDDCLGVMVMGYPEAGAFGRLERDKLGMLAGQFALAFERARLLAAERESARRIAALAVENERAARRAKALAAISKTLTQTEKEFDSLIKQVTDSVSAFFGDLSILTLASTDGEAVTPASFSSPDPIALENVSLLAHPLRAGEGLAGRVLAQGEPLLIRQLDIETLAPSLPPAHLAFMRRYPIHSALVVPVQLGEKLLGTLGVLRSTPGTPFEESDALFLRQVSERVAFAVENSRLYAALKESVQVREDFISVASHELKTPLTPLLLQLQRLQRLLGDHADAKSAGAFAAMNRQVERLHILINNLLDVSRLSSGDLRIEPVEFDFSALIRESVARVLEGARAQSGFVSLEMPERLIFTGDRLRMDQVVTNLVSNAMKYGAGKPVSVRLRRDQGTVAFEVEDRGIGISEEFRSRLFQKYERSSAVRGISGLGLGLFIVGQIVKAHGGQVSLRSAPGKGSTFTVTLPEATSRTTNQS